MQDAIGIDLSCPVEVIIDNGTHSYRIIIKDCTVERLTKWQGRRPPKVLQCALPHRNKIYAPDGTLTFCRAGCLVCSLTSLLSWADAKRHSPVMVANMLGQVGAFSGNLLGHPSKVEKAFPLVKWHKASHWHSIKHGNWETSYISWTHRAADLTLLDSILRKQPVIVEVDYNPLDKKVDQHFVLAYQYLPDKEGGLNDDLLVMDPVTGYTSVLTYFNPSWLGNWMAQNEVSKVARTLTGTRIWEVN